MRKILLSIGIFLWLLLSLRAEEPLPISFIRTAMQTHPVPYEEEIKLFPELSLHSYVLLSQLGYVDSMGKWKKARPKFSPLLELIRINRATVWGTADVLKMEYFTGDVKWYRDGREGDRMFYKLSCVILSFSQDESKTVVFTMHNTEMNRKIDFPITVNGKNLARMLGFVYKDGEEGVPQLDPSVLARLKDHLDNLP